MEKKNNSLVIILMGVIIVILAVLCVLFATGKINLKSNEPSNETNNQEVENQNITNNESENQNEIQKAKYEGQSFVGCYQILNRDGFATSKYDSSKLSSIDLEIQLLEDGTAKVAYQLNDQGHQTKNQYDATYELVNTTTEQIDGDYYKVLQLKFNTNEAKNDNNISFLEKETITYNPASNPTDGSQAFPKSLVFKGGGGNIIPYMINSNELKYIK